MSTVTQDWSPAPFRTQVAVLTARTVRSSWADRKLAVLGLLQPVVLLLLFSQVFAGVAALPGVAVYGSYVNFLVPATMVNVALTTAIGSGAGLLSEMYNGVLARFRVLPINLLAVLAGRITADVVRLAAQLVLVLAVATAVLGFRPGDRIGGLLGALALCLALGWGLSWLFVAICAWARTPQTLQAVGFVAIFPLMFSSTAYMPVDSLPGWLRAIAVLNPLSYGIDAARLLALGGPATGPVLIALGLTAVVAACSIAVAARSIRKVGP